MRSFYVAFYNQFHQIGTTTIQLELGEKADELTIQEKVNEKYYKDIINCFCVQVVSWSLIEE